VAERNVGELVRQNARDFVGALRLVDQPTE